MNQYIDHIYKNGYSVLPNLKKLGKEPVFLNTDTFDYLEEKKKAIKNQKCFLEFNINQKTYDVVCDFISSQTNSNKSNFEEMAMLVQEDLVVHRIKENKDWMAACHICFPSGWLPEEKIGKCFQEIHSPIPGMNLNNSFNLARSMIYNGPFVRFVWSIVYERKVNSHPSLPYKNFDPSNPRIWIKVERQITYGFEEIESALFVIRQEIIEPEEIDYKSLYKSCSEMSPEHKKYKNISQELLDWLGTI
jgi:hypothetical protein